MTQHDKCRCGADLPRTEPGVELASRHIPGSVECLTRQVAAANERADKAERERNLGHAACAAILAAARKARGAISSNYLGVSSEAKMRQMAEARMHLDPICDQPNPGQPFLDRLTNAETALGLFRRIAPRLMETLAHDHEAMTLVESVLEAAEPAEKTNDENADR